ncbi:hypothetical protein PDE01_16320 [Paracoccus denitrificans]|nr:hypothetical protein PDE01_16320 [Paracoccus denitrificans]
MQRQAPAAREAVRAIEDRFVINAPPTIATTGKGMGAHILRPFAGQNQMRSAKT